MFSGGEEPASRPRVCDRCIRQKVKCDLGKPQCSRCIERGLSCAYSSIRRKPGPSPGSRRTHVAASLPGRSGVRRSTLRDALRTAYPPGLQMESDMRNLDTATLIPPALPVSVQQGVETYPPAEKANAPTPVSEAFHISAEEQQSLLAWYFGNLHKAVPLFLGSPNCWSDETISQAVSECSYNLTLTIITISAKLSGVPLSSVSETEIDAQVDRVLGASSLQGEIAGDTPTLDQFRQSCISAFYEYHQCPGKQAWMRVSKLVRWAYWAKLDQIEIMRQASKTWGSLSEDKIEEWRLVWWCIFRFDSYANLATGMPYGIDERLINTVMPSSGATDRRVCLPYQPYDLVDTARDLLVEGTSRHMPAQEIQIISIAILRYVGRALRLRIIGESEAIVALIIETERRLSGLQLALPANFFNPRRNAFANEPDWEHHFRLITIHHMLMARMLIAVSHCRRPEEDHTWLESWQEVLEVCQDVTAIARRWDSSFCLSVDPALCIIAFVSLVFLNLHLKFARSTGSPSLMANHSLCAEIEHCESILLLFLEQFAKSWTLPRLLMLSFKGFKEALPNSIGHRQIQVILHRFESPLHPTWLHFLQSADKIFEGCQ